MKYLIYKVESDAHRGQTRKFTTLADAVGYARLIRREGWWAKVTDMRTAKVILGLGLGKLAESE